MSLSSFHPTCYHLSIMQENRFTTTSPKAKAIYGYELVVNASGCSDPSLITKPKLAEFTTELCQAIDMKMVLEPFFWDAIDSDKPHVQGTSFVQFLETSSIVIHTLTITEIVFLNVFSCKEFNPAVVEQHVQQFFQPQHLDSQLIERTYVAKV